MVTTRGALPVSVCAGGAWASWDWADPVVGLAITVATAFVLKDAARQVYRRLMDAVDPTLVDQAETILRAIRACVRWPRCDCVDRPPAPRRSRHRRRYRPEVSRLAAHCIAADAAHQLTHAIPRLATATVHADPDCHPARATTPTCPTSAPNRQLTWGRGRAACLPGPPHAGTG